MHDLENLLLAIASANKPLSRRHHFTYTQTLKTNDSKKNGILQNILRKRIESISIRKVIKLLIKMDTR